MINTPININSTQLRNRIVMPPMATGKTSDGKPTDELIDYYVDRSVATALIIMEHSYVSYEGQASEKQLSMADDKVIDQYKKLTEAVHRNGASIIAQINHAGAMGCSSQHELLSSSDVTISRTGRTAKEMTKVDIDRIIEQFVEAAKRSDKAGFDGVEIHAAHGYLLNQFYSPLINHRTDDYSGSTIIGRTRLQKEIIEAVRAEVRTDFIISIRFGACDYMEGGSEVKDVSEASKIFEKSGADMISISGGLNGFMIKGNNTPGWFSELSTYAKNSVGIPVLLTGGITTADQAEKLLKTNAADLIGVGRAMSQDSKWTEKNLSVL